MGVTYSHYNSSPEFLVVNRGMHKEERANTSIINPGELI